MAADLHIHVFSEGELEEDDFATFFSNALGSKWFTWDSASPEERDKVLDKISHTPNIWAGEVSWLKAALFEDKSSYIPSTVDKINRIIGEHLLVVDDNLIAEIKEAFTLPNSTSYSLALCEEVVAFLEEHKGKRAFTVSW